MPAKLAWYLANLPSPQLGAFLPLMEEKEEKEDQGTKGVPAKLAWYLANLPRPRLGAFLPLMEEKEAKEDQALNRGRGSLPATR